MFFCEFEIYMISFLSERMNDSLKIRVFILRYEFSNFFFLLRYDRYVFYVVISIVRYVMKNLLYHYQFLVLLFACFFHSPNNEQIIDKFFIIKFLFLVFKEENQEENINIDRQIFVEKKRVNCSKNKNTHIQYIFKMAHHQITDTYFLLFSLSYKIKPTQIIK